MEAIMKRDLSPAQRAAIAAVALVIIVLVVTHLLTGMGIIGGPDAMAGYYMLQVNSDSNATPEQMQGSSIFGMQRLVLNDNYTFRLATLHGNWSRSGDRVSLEPTQIPPADTFFTQTSMGQALAILLKPCDLTVSTNGKTLTADRPTNGAVVFTKVNDVMK
jgi:hypothetical protein